MSNVKVAVRARPLNKSEIENNSNILVRMKGDVVEIVASSAGASHRSTFDYAFWSCNTFVPGNANENAPQEVVYDKIGAPMVVNVFQGLNSCLFAYGQTGSGKTYTTMGDPRDEGIAPRMSQDFFEHARTAQKHGHEVIVEVTFLEIYNEKVRCLLNPDPKGFEGKKLRIREHPKHGTFVEGLASFVVSNQRELHEFIVVGNKMRTTGATLMNMNSSRSHAVLTVTVTQTKRDGALVTTRRSHMNLVDLAGSERADKTGAAGARLVEGSSINRSLSTLGMVISSLAEGKDKFIPYRDSALTQILKDTLGGNSMTTMLATISPANSQYEETISTLRYAECAKKIKNKAVVNESNNSEVIATLQKEIAELKEKLKAAAPGSKDRDAMNDEIELSETIRQSLSMSMQDRREHNRQLLAEREHNIDELRKQVEDQEGQLSSLRIANRAKDQKIQDLLAKLMQLSDSADETRKESIREEIARLEIETQQAPPQAQAAPKAKDAADINDNAAQPAQESPASPATAAASRLVAALAAQDDGDVAVEEDDIELDDDDIDIDDFEAEAAAGGEPEMDDIELDDDEFDGIAMEDEDIDIDDMEEAAAAAEQAEATAAEEAKKSPVPAGAAAASPTKKAEPEAQAPPTVVKHEDISKEEHDFKALTVNNMKLPTVHEPVANVPTIRLKSHELPQNRYLHEPFRVVKIDEDALISARKERIWDVNFFAKKFGNLDLTGYESFSQPTMNLYRVEKHPNNSHRLTLYFFEAPHPYDLQFTSTERRQRFYELAMAQRRNSVMWCPSLIPDDHTDANIVIQGTSIERPNGKVVKVKGEVCISAAKMPYEVIDLWFGCLSLQNKPLPRSATVLGSFMPKAVHEVYIIGMTDVPAVYMGSSELGDYFLSFLGPSVYFVLSSTAAAPVTKKSDTNSVFIVICRRSFIVRMSCLEAMEVASGRREGITASDISAVGCSLKINEASIGCVLIQASNRAIDASVRAAAIRGIMANFPFGDTSVDVGTRFDYFIAAGAFGFGGDFTSDDMLLKQMKAGNLLSDVQEEVAPSNISSRPNPMRILFAARPRSCRMDCRAYNSSRAMDGVNVYANFDVFCQRAYLSTFGAPVPKTKIFFGNFVLGGQRIPHINHPELQVSADWLESSPVVFKLQCSDDAYTVTGNAIPVFMPSVHNADFLRLQHVHFTLYGHLPSSKDKKRIVVASGSLSLKNVIALGSTVDFTIPLYYRGCNVGTLQSDILHVYSESVASDLEAAGVHASERFTHVVTLNEVQVLNKQGNWVPAAFADDQAYDWSEQDNLKSPLKREDCKLPADNWKWLTQWRHESTKADVDGWGFGIVAQNAVEVKRKKEHKYRRRKWMRVMQAPSAILLHNYILQENDRKFALQTASNNK